VTSPHPTGGWPARLAIASRDLLEFIRDRRALFITLVMPMAMYPLLALSSTLGIRTAILELDRRQESRQLHFVFSGAEAEALAIRIGALANRSDGSPEGWPETVTVRVVDPTSAQSLIDEGAADAWIDVPGDSLATLDGAGTLPVTCRRARRLPSATSCRRSRPRCSCSWPCLRRPVRSIQPSTRSQVRRNGARSRRCSSLPARCSTSWSASSWRCSR